MGKDDKAKGRPLSLDSEAESADPNLPAFVARPKGAPVYHGYPALKDVVVDGFMLGKITDWEQESCEEGDAYVIAPDGSRCGLVWSVSTEGVFEQVLGFEKNRWGVWGVNFPDPMRTRVEARENLKSILPDLQEKWEEWKRWLLDIND